MPDWTDFGDVSLFIVQSLWMNGKRVQKPRLRANALENEAALATFPCGHFAIHTLIASQQLLSARFTDTRRIACQIYWQRCGLTQKHGLVECGVVSFSIVARRRSSETPS